MPKTVSSQSAPQSAPQSGNQTGAKPPAPAQTSPQASAKANKTQQVKSARPFSWRSAFLTTLFRLLLLGVGGSITAAVGIAAAQIYPAQSQKLPLVSELAQQAEAKLAKSLTHLPAPLVQLLPDSLVQPAAMQTGLSQESSPVDAVTPTANASPTASSLTDTERQQMQTELTQLQAELQTLTSQTTEPLAERVEEIQKRIQSIQAKLNAFTAADPQPFVATPSVSTPTAHAGQQPLLVTLPSDALFEMGSVTLRPGTAAILDSILVDLERYNGASIQVAAYSDQQQSADLDRQKTLEQARAVQKYLAGQMDQSIHWVTVGQGHNRPLAPEDSETNRQRNRRIEISILP
ncbi:MAG: OmpA family protein [Elainella sp.]